MDLLEQYGEMMTESPHIEIRRKTCEGTSYYFEFQDLTYIRVDPNPDLKVYECKVLDPRSEFRSVLYGFNLGFKRVTQEGNFEKVLVDRYNNVVKAIVMNGFANDCDRAMAKFDESTRWDDGSKFGP